MSEAFPASINQLLAALPESEYQRLIPHLEYVSLSLGQILYEPGEMIREVYFPYEAMISIVSVLKDNSTTEIGLVGNEGMVGLPVFLGGNCSISRAIVQIAGTVMKLKADILKSEFQRGEELQRLLLLYTQARLTQVSQMAVCKSHHGIDKRLARWLLSVQDCVQKDEFLLTQKFISEMLGVRRASVTEAASLLQQAGIIRYTRGQITILNRTVLESTTCECYSLIRDEFMRLLGRSQGDREE